jgi:hypothetical protein
MSTLEVGPPLVCAAWLPARPRTRQLTGLAATMSGDFSRCRAFPMVLMALLGSRSSQRSQAFSLEEPSRASRLPELVVRLPNWFVSDLPGWLRLEPHISETPQDAAPRPTPAERY